MRRFRQFIEYLLLTLILAIFRVLPLDTASSLGGWIGRRLGPLLSVHQVADRNIQRALPELSPQDRGHTLTGMWDNLGRTIAEYPHLNTAAMTERIHMDDLDLITRLRGSGKPILFIGAHLANWEIAAKSSQILGLPLMLVYRPTNNPYVDRIIRRIRLSFCADLQPKGFRGASQAVRAIRAGHSVGMLIDQKMNDGIALPFFGIDAMTAPAAAEIAVKYDVPLIFCRIERLEGVHFRVSFVQPQKPASSAIAATNAAALMGTIHTILEDWIRSRPEQWFWVHKRWGK